MTWPFIVILRLDPSSWSLLLRPTRLGSSVILTSIRFFAPLLAMFSILLTSFPSSCCLPRPWILPLSFMLIKLVVLAVGLVVSVPVIPSVVPALVPIVVILVAIIISVVVIIATTVVISAAISPAGLSATSTGPRWVRMPITGASAGLLALLVVVVALLVTSTVSGYPCLSVSLAAASTTATSLSLAVVIVMRGRASIVARLLRRLWLVGPLLVLAAILALWLMVSLRLE